MSTTEARYRDTSLPVQERVDDLLARMTIEEKVAQLGSVWAFQIISSDGLRRDRADAILGGGIGEITRLAGSTNLWPVDVAEKANEIQRYLVTETRLGIPAIIHEECLHGLLARGAPGFQQSIGAAASFDPALVGRVAETINRRMLATGARHALAPVLDIARDPRWGRIEETYGEDPYLAAAMGIAYTRGLQGPRRDQGIIATAKHMVGHGLAEGGLNQAPVHAGWRELRDEQLFPFEAVIREAGIGSVMPAYCDVDGVPCHASRQLLATILRDEWEFDGVISSDYLGIEQIALSHRITDHFGTAGALALAAGVDFELPRRNAYDTPLLAAIERGEVDVTLLDAAVTRVLRMKVALGLFENPYVDVPTDDFFRLLATEEARLGRQLARRSMVLVENDGILPIVPGTRVAVVGPIADSARDLLGDYSHMVHLQTLKEMHARENPFGFAEMDQITPEDELVGRASLLDVLRDRLGADRVTYARGTGLREGTDEEIAEAIVTARASDLVLAFLGERSGLTDDATTGEARDRRDLHFLGRQQELVRALVATGVPVVLVVVSGRPLALEWEAAHCAAVLLAWVPGDEGAEAIVDVLTGDVNPGGKLPISMPRHVGQVPVFARHHPTGGRSNWKGDYVDGSAAPLWPFGFGRSYTTFELSDFTVSATAIDTTDGECEVSLIVTNTGGCAGDEVVQLYFRDEEAEVARPVVELLGFARVSLAPGARASVRFDLVAEQFAFTGVEYLRIVEPGRILLRAGTSAADLPFSAVLELRGPKVGVPRRSRFLTPVEVMPALD